MKKNEFKVLVAEDDAVVRDVIIKFLEEEGYAVIVANDGVSAIELLRLEDIKLVLADLRMPGADGMEVLRKAVQMNPKISVVLLTAYGTLDTALEAMKEGAYDYIVKPFVMQQLLLVVRNAYRMAVLMEENEWLSNHLKELYRNCGESTKITGKAVSGKDASESAGRIDKLRELNIIDPEEARILKERLNPKSAERGDREGSDDTESRTDDNDPDKGISGDLKRYSSLVNNLKTNR